MERVLSGEVAASVSAIREERTSRRSDERSFAVGGTFLDYLERFDGTSDDFAAGIAAHVLRRWKEPQDRGWFAQCMRTAAEMIDDNLERKVPLLELPRTTARRLNEERAG